jgi:hypothetical protein
MKSRKGACCEAQEPAQTTIASKVLQPSAGYRPESVGHSEQPRLAGLTYHLLQPDRRFEQHSPLVDEAYRCWRAVWEPTFAELTGLTKLYSDEFARQHELVTLFEDTRCVGLTGFRYIDLDSAIIRQDSYFGNWSDEAFAAARAWGREACIIGNFMVTPEHRGRRGGVSLSELVTILSLYRLTTSPANVALVTTRNDRRVNQLMYRFGAHRLFENATMYGVSVDLVAFPREETKAKLRESMHDTIIRQLTSERSVPPASETEREGDRSDQ